ncbi:MAG: hypothetical protein WC340_13560 [Kiritimatiellia bacterium]
MEKGAFIKVLADDEAFIGVQRPDGVLLKRAAENISEKLDNEHRK